MKICIYSFLFAISVLSSCSESVQERKTSLSLDGAWQFRKAGDSTWMTATVPGSVHTDLLSNGIIEDPFYRLNEHQVQWVDKEDWEYQTTFEVSQELLRQDVAELVFEGLDTYAEVYLNEQLLLTADNMFREWKAECSQLLSPGTNTLRILFKSPIQVGLALHDSLDYTIPVSDNDLSEIGGVGDKKVSVFLRKAGYHFGWDWGPRLVTSGIWKPVRLQAWKKAIIRDVFVRQTALSDDEARLTVEATVEAASEGEVILSISVDANAPDQKSVRLKKGTNVISTPVAISSPRRWWPNGIGEQNLYKIGVALLSDGENIDSRSVSTGLRTVQVMQEPDSIGKSFYFRINGIPVFMKGANYIPQDIFLNRVTPSDYERLVQSAADANMNMLRVWGGGIYEKDIFYDLCDRYGILVWQDFMFACAMFPGDEAFLANVKQEAVDNVVRLRNHPSIALWAGNNEILSAWHDWGWSRRVAQEQGKEVAEKLYQAYDQIFHHILDDAVKTCDPDRFYWSSSPQAAIGVPANFTSGDYHYWGVWWGKEPFTNYETTIPRFMSEFGFQSFPELSTVRKYATEADWDINSEVMKSHQRSSIGNVTIEEYLLRHYKRPRDFPMFLYVNHILQAEGIRIGMEAHRRNRQRCMGSLYWQINDCWPVASWSSTDYYGQWKALHYAVKKSFAKTIVSTEREDKVLNIYTVTDSLSDFPANLSVRFINFAGKILFEKDSAVAVKGNSSQLQWQMDLRPLLKAGADKENTLIELSLLRENGSRIARSLRYLAAPKKLDLPSPEVKMTVQTEEGRSFITLSTDLLAKNVYLRVPVEGHFSDNYFDLLPGEEVKVTFTPKGKLAAGWEKQLEIFTLVDSF